MVRMTLACVALLGTAAHADLYDDVEHLIRNGQYERARFYVKRVNDQPEQLNSQSLWLALRIERKLGDKVSEAGFAGQLRRRFAGTPEHQALMQGKYD